jgi:hypothetical protein
VLAGPSTAAERVRLADPALGGSIRHVGRLPRAEALALQRSADRLLVLTNGAPSMATGKLYEYLKAARPIVVLGDATAAAEVVNDTHSGWTAPADEPAAIAATLQTAVEQEPPARDEAAVARHGYDRIAARMSELITRVVAARGR